MTSHADKRPLPYPRVETLVLLRTHFLLALQNIFVLFFACASSRVATGENRPLWQLNGGRSLGGGDVHGVTEHHHLQEVYGRSLVQVDECGEWLAVQVVCAGSERRPPLLLHGKWQH